MLWIMLISLAVMSIRDTVSARKRGEPITLAQSFRLNFKKLKERLRQNFQKQKAWLKMKLGTVLKFINRLLTNSFHDLGNSISTGAYLIDRKMKNRKILNYGGIKMKKAKKVLVTGADGLLGSNVVRELLEQGHRVRVLVQPGSLSPALKGLLPMRIITGDLLYDLKELQKAVSGCDTVIHCAALTSFSADPDLVQRVNVEGTKNIMDACLDRGVGRFIHVGSASSFQFGSLEDPGSEEGGFPEVYERITYMRSKYEAMNLVKKYVESYDLDAVIVAPTFMFGPHDARPSSGEMIRQFIIRNMIVTSPGGRNFVHVRDVARAIVAAQEKGRRGESYILGGENLSYLDFFSKVATITGKKPPRVAVPKFIVIAGGMAATAYQGLAGKRLVFNLSIAVSGSLQAYYSSSKAERELGLTHTPLEKAISDSFQSLVEYGHLEEEQWNN